jgi:Zn-finger nucleic acid-binding protein
MSTHPYFGPGSIVIDTCDACDLVWLDVGELKQVVDAPGADRGRKGMPPDY